jgi:polyhydroxyalkanoate synthesis regulator phasin
MYTTPKKVRLCRNSPYAAVLSPVNKVQDPVENGEMSSDDLRREVRQLTMNVETILRELAPLRTLEDMKNSLAMVTEKLVRIGEENRVLSERVDSQAKTIDNLNLQLNDLEQHSRRDYVEILGVEERQGENCEDMVVALARSNGISIDRSDISIAHRLPNTGGGRRKIIAKFMGIGTRNRVFRAVRSGRTTVTDLNRELQKMKIPQLDITEGRQNIFINESLTRYNRGIFIRTLSLKKKLKLFSAWTDDGKTKMRVTGDGPIIVFRSEEEVNDFETELKS